MTTRRSFLKGGLTGLAAWAIFGRKEAQAQVPVAYPPLIVSRRVSQIPLDPFASDWKLAIPLIIPLAPQIIVKPRESSGVSLDLLVRSLYDEERVGFLLEPQGEWLATETPEMPRQGIGRTDHYGDSLALQIPADITQPIPYFGMGEVNNQVIIYQWKSAWQFAPHYDVDEEFKGMWTDFYPYAGKGPGQMVEGRDYGQEGKEWPADKAFNTGWAAGNIVSNPELKEKSPIQKLVATGFSNLTTDANQDGSGQGVWGHNWHVVITFPRKLDRYKIMPGRTTPIAFAAWQGHLGQRGGQKLISAWASFVPEKGVLPSSIALAVVTAVAIGALEWLILRRRRKATTKESK